MLLCDSDNRLSVGTWSGRPTRVLLPVTCFAETRRPGRTAHADAALWAPALNGAFAAVLMFLYRNGAI